MTGRRFSNKRFNALSVTQGYLPSITLILALFLWLAADIGLGLVIGHSPATATPVDYVLRENQDGSVSCIVGTMDLPSRTQWRVEVRLPADRAYFGDFDPFGDFDLIFGAAKQNLQIVEVPVRYYARTYGETQISRFRHGWKLLMMVVFAWRKLKAF